MRIHRDERGQTIMLVALSLPLMLGFVGIATDVGSLFKNKRDIQAAADAAAIAGALNITTGNWRSAATTAATSYGYTDGTNGTTVTVNNGPTWAASNYLGQTNYIEVTISKSESTIFLSLFGYPSVNVLTRAVATNQGAGHGCVYTLQTTGTDLTVQGNPGITAAACAFNINSGDANAVQEIGKGGNVITSSIGVVGPITQGKSYADFQPQPVGGAVAASDPMSANEFPYTCSSSGCTCDTTSTIGASCTNNPVSLPGTNYGSCNAINVPNKGTVTLNPGCYDLGGAKGTTVGAQNTLTLNSSGGGVYFFTNGVLTLQAGATMNAVGVTMIFTGNSTINMGGGPVLDMIAPTTDPNATSGYLATATFPGTLYYQVPADTATLNLQGNSNTNVAGIFYAPTASVVLQGTSGGSLYTDFVVGTLTLQGTPDLLSYAQLPGGASNGLHSVTLVE